MLFRQLFDTASSTYSYLLADPTSKAAVLIDPVFEHHARDRALIEELGLKLLYTLDTHAHADHVTGAWLMKQVFGSKIVLSKRYEAKEVDHPVDHGDVIQFGDYAVEVRATPGHTAGCVSFVPTRRQMVFTGDCLLIRGAGRTDFQQGDAHQMFHSIHEQLFALPEDCLIYPAHDYAGRTASTVAEEKAFNARIGGEADETDFVGFMQNLKLPHPKQIDIALPANMRCGKPEADVNLAPASWGPVSLTYAGIPQVDPHWVQEHLSNVQLIDVRTRDELSGELGQLQGAIHLPLDEVSDRAAELPKDRPLVTVCRSGRRSGQATTLLKRAGRTDCASMAGGLLRWRSEHL